MAESKTGRDDTDKSLAFERNKTDEELLKRSRTDEARADEIVALARRRAADVLARARTAADEKLSADEIASRAGERAAEDAVRAREHASADDVLESERAARRRWLTELLALEREQTNHHLAEERLRADAAIGSRDDVLAMVSHDMRNMLASIHASAHSLVARGDPATARDALHIRTAATRMQRLVGDLLDVVNIDAGRFAVQAERQDVATLVRDTEEVFRPLATTKRIAFDATIANAPTAPRYDRLRVQQVLDNLLGNALKFTAEGGRISLRVDALGDDILFVVSDDGPGIPPEQLQAVFERFSQATNLYARTGLGLGLHISKRIVEAHGGKIWAERRSQGAALCFTLPSASAAP